jgi:hypothetical protein
MINLYNQVPTIYSNASRDFQYLSWLINIVLNSVKHNVDDLYDLPNNKSDPRLAELLATTLGFKIKRSYDQRQLIALVSIIPSILKCKGTISAINMAGRALVKASGAIGVFSCSVDTENSCIEVVFPEGLVDTTLFMDLLPYILPAGMTCRITEETREVLTLDEDKKIDVRFSDTLYADWEPSLAEIDGVSSGLSTLFEVGKEPIFTNYSYENSDAAGNPILNTGLSSNTVIPGIDQLELGAVEAYVTEENEYGTTVKINKYSIIENDQGTTIKIGGS